MSQAEHDRRIDYIEFFAADLEAVKAFYGAALGWQFTDWGPDYTSFADGRLAGGFHRGDGGGGNPLVVLYAADLEAMEAAVQRHGGTVLREIFSFPGGRRFHFSDPAGNELAVWSEDPNAEGSEDE